MRGLWQRVRMHSTNAGGSRVSARSVGLARSESSSVIQRTYSRAEAKRFEPYSEPGGSWQENSEIWSLWCDGHEFRRFTRVWTRDSFIPNREQRGMMVVVQGPQGITIFNRAKIFWFEERGM
jgi:hypothetical protein